MKVYGSFYVRYKRRSDLRWAMSRSMTWTSAKTVADELARLGFESEVRGTTWRMAMKVGRAS
jgi:hypothetical protein